MKLLLRVLLIVGLFLSSCMMVGAQSGERIEFSIFSRADCIHCIELHRFLDQSYTGASQTQPRYYDMSDPSVRRLYDDFTLKYGIARVTPIILIGDEVIIGFRGVETTGREILERAGVLSRSSYFETASGVSLMSREAGGPSLQQTVSAESSLSDVSESQKPFSTTFVRWTLLVGIVILIGGIVLFVIARRQYQSR